MPAKTGLTGSVLLDDAAINIKLTEWILEESGENVKTGGAGDAYVERRPLRKDWKATCKGEVQTGTNFNLHADSVNDDAVIAMFIDESHANPYAVGTGLMTIHNITSNFLQPIEVSFTVECSGTGLTKDLTPVT